MRKLLVATVAAVVLLQPLAARAAYVVWEGQSLKVTETTKGGGLTEIFKNKLYHRVITERCSWIAVSPTGIDYDRSQKATLQPREKIAQNWIVHSLGDGWTSTNWSCHVRKRSYVP